MSPRILIPFMTLWFIVNSLLLLYFNVMISFWPNMFDFVRNVSRTPRSNRWLKPSGHFVHLLSFTDDDRYSVLRTSSSSHGPTNLTSSTTTSPITSGIKTSDVGPNVPTPVMSPRNLVQGQDFSTVVGESQLITDKSSESRSVDLTNNGMGIILERPRPCSVWWKTKIMFGKGELLLIMNR